MIQVKVKENIVLSQHKEIVFSPRIPVKKLICNSSEARYNALFPNNQNVCFKFAKKPKAEMIHCIALNEEPT